MSLVKGENYLVEFYISGEWKPYACARSCNIDIDTELIETTVTGSGKNKHFTPTVNSFSGALEGLASLNMPSHVTIYNLRQYQLAHVLQRVRFKMTAMDGSSYTEMFYFFITKSSIIGAFDNVVNFTIQFQGTGVLDQTIVEPPIIITKVKRYDYTGTGGEIGFTEPVLINKDILQVVKDGLGNSRIITSGSPASKEVKYESTTGQFTWAVEFEAGEEAYVLYQDL